jgi:NIMA (never in mitosis gene a)-related kinase
MDLTELFLVAGRTYALKKVNIAKMPLKEREFAVNEIRLLASLNNPHVIGYCDAFIENNTLFIVTDYARKGDLRMKIKRYKRAGKKFAEEDIWKYFIQMATGLEYLHKHNVIHRDLKPGNIFCYSSSHLQLGDLGCSLLIKDKLPRNQVGTPYYMAPEVWKQVRYNEKSDVWSIGVILFEMCAMRTPFTAEDIKSLATKVKYNPVPDIPGNYSSLMRNLVRSMLNKDPQMRPSMKQILTMPEVAKHQAKVPSLTESQATRCFGGSTQATSANARNISPEMLRTIKVTHNMCQIALPPPRYPGMQTSKSADCANPNIKTDKDVLAANDENAAPIHNTAAAVINSARRSSQGAPPSQPYTGPTYTNGITSKVPSGAPPVSARGGTRGTVGARGTGSRATGRPGGSRATSAKRGIRPPRPANAASAWARDARREPVVGNGGARKPPSGGPRGNRRPSQPRSKAAQAGYNGYQPRGRRIYTR